MDIQEVKKQYEELIRSEDPIASIFKFKVNLLSSDSDQFLDFHLSILTDRKKEAVYNIVRSFFDERKDKIKTGEFLYNEYKSGIGDITLKADVIQILGYLRSKYAKMVALENLNADKGDLRYRCIIVLGWVGTAADLVKLNERLVQDKDPNLRGYAATAMRQLWFNHPKTKDEILIYIKEAIVNEKSEEALQGMILTVQDLTKKKLGLKESKYGDVSGDIVVATDKTIEALQKI
ncbi:HEAT repeat domain-containing protein [uncultured Cytophaga sp.]|uniref:HEAT repeat domain-containing protein n=1 Tax=uncultured Cytophaga sp. TaxID=160238 RepID=UPI00262FF052|nr:HEAT repeat domain-containing protein [uncultured Cytophaga sp.]